MSRTFFANQGYGQFQTFVAHKNGSPQWRGVDDERATSSAHGIGVAVVDDDEFVTVRVEESEGLDTTGMALVSDSILHNDGEVIEIDLEPFAIDSNRTRVRIYRVLDDHLANSFVFWLTPTSNNNVLDVPDRHILFNRPSDGIYLMVDGIRVSPQGRQPDLEMRSESISIKVLDDDIDSALAEVIYQSEQPIRNIKLARSQGEANSSVWVDEFDLEKYRVNKIATQRIDDCINVYLVKGMRRS